MTAAEWFLLVPTLCYVASAGCYWLEGRYGLALTFFAYATANVGLIVAGSNR